jgi:hypothetical protein
MIPTRQFNSPGLAPITSAFARISAREGVIIGTGSTKWTLSTPQRLLIQRKPLPISIAVVAHIILGPATAPFSILKLDVAVEMPILLPQSLEESVEIFSGFSSGEISARKKHVVYLDIGAQQVDTFR